MMRPSSIIAALSCVTISSLLLRNLWVRQEGSVGKKKLWSLIICVPFIGWLFYGAFYNPPKQNRIKAKGGASGWGYWGGA